MTPCDNDEIPWGEILPSGLIHVVAPTLQEIGPQPDLAMIAIGAGISVELEEHKVMWAQFGTDFNNHEGIRSMMGAGGLGAKEHLHCINAQCVADFVRLWAWGNDTFEPRVWVLYDPWLAPFRVKGHAQMANYQQENWDHVLLNLHPYACNTTIIVLNRVKRQKLAAIQLDPWNIAAEHIQNFHEDKCEHDWKPAALGSSSEIHECSKCGETERRDRPL